MIVIYNSKKMPTFMFRHQFWLTNTYRLDAINAVLFMLAMHPPQFGIMPNVMVADITIYHRHLSNVQNANLILYNIINRKMACLMENVEHVLTDTKLEICK